MKQIKNGIFIKIAKLNPKPQLQLGAEVVIFSINPTTQTATHPDEFEISMNQQSFVKTKVVQLHE